VARFVGMITRTQKPDHAESFWRLARNGGKTQSSSIYCDSIAYYTWNRLIVIHKMLSSQNYMNIWPRNKYFC
jgi:hypothetical protein